MDRAVIQGEKKTNFLGLFEIKIISLIILTSVLSATAVFLSIHREHEKADVINLQHTAESIFHYASEYITPESFAEINVPGDVELPQYQQIQRRLDRVRKISNMKYLYTIKRNSQGQAVYHIDGLLNDQADFQNPGDLVENTILDDVEKALNGSIVMASKIKETDYGYIYASYWPYKDQAGNVLGVIGLEYDATVLVMLERSSLVRSIIGLVIIIVFLSVVFSFLFKGVTRPFHKQIAYIDILTGLSNRTAFELDKRRINNDLAGYKNISLIMFDLNNLKEVNDTFGHNKGDSYIVLAAELIEKYFGPYGISYRIGGDEFCVISIDNEEKILVDILENNFAKDVFSRKDTIKHNGRGYFAIAYGLAMFDIKVNKDIHETFNTADERMYAKKREMKADS